MGFNDIGMHVRMKISQRPLDIIYMIDTSGSMYGDKIKTVNKAMHELETLLRKEAANNPSAQVNVRIITYGDDKGSWHLKERTDVDKFKYQDITYVNGSTPLGYALNMLNQALSKENMPERGLRPIVVLLSDGQPNDNWKNNLNKLNSLPWGDKAIRVAIAIGSDADKSVLAEFTRDPKLVLEANSVEELTNFIKWTSTLVSHVTQSHSERNNDGKIVAAEIHPPKTMQRADDNEDFI